MKTAASRRHVAQLLIATLSALTITISSRELGAQLNENCTVSILNRTANVRPDGRWRIFNVPANFGPVRARATCSQGGVTQRAQTRLLEIDTNRSTGFENQLTLGVVNPIPELLTVSSPLETLTVDAPVAQLQVLAEFAEGVTLDVTEAAAGTVYTISNPAIASVDADGLVNATASGVALISAMNDGALGVVRLSIVFSGDSDGDGIPDDVELSSGLDPNNPVDAFEDTDGDGLTNLDELTVFGSDITSADSDGDGISDGEEVVVGADGFVTNPVLADTDGDGIRDALEIATGSDPTDAASLNLAAALQSISVAPTIFSLTVSSIFGEVFQQLVVTGLLLDGTSLDITSNARGTSYATSDATVCNFGAEDGRIFAGGDGNCVIDVDTNGFSVSVPGAVTTFNPQQVGRLDLPFFGNNLDVDGDFLFVAGATGGLAVVDVSDPTQPTLVATLGLAGNANDVKVRNGLAYVAAHDAGLHIIDVSDPLSPTLVNSVDTPGLAIDVALSGDYAFVADDQEGLQVVDISYVAAATIVSSHDTQGSANGVDTDGNILVMSTPGEGGSLGFATVVDVSDPFSPVEIATVFVGQKSFDVKLAGGFAYIATARDLAVIDLTDPSSPELLGVFGPRIFMTDVVAVTDTLLVTTRVLPDTEAPIYNVSAPDTPVTLGAVSFDRFGDGTGLAAAAPYVYMTSSDNEITNFKPVTTAKPSRLLVGQFLPVLDTTSPVVTIVTPANGGTAFEGGELVVVVDATDDRGVFSVSLDVDGVSQPPDVDPPFEFSVTVPVGVTTMRFEAIATDISGNVSQAARADLVVRRDTFPPGITIVSPTSGATAIEGTVVSVLADVADESALSGVSFTVNGALAGSDAESPFTFDITAPLGASSLTIGAIAEDRFGNIGVATPVDINIITDPLTLVTGRVLNADDELLENAQLTCLGLTATSTASGTFSVSNVPTNQGPITCSAEFVQPTGQSLMGISTSASPVPDGTTDVGDIVVFAAPLFPVAKHQVGSQPVAVATGDFNNDGLRDIATANEGDSSVSILLATGNGRFEPEIALTGPTIDNPFGLKASDIDNDGDIDLLVLNSFFNRATLLLGDGGGGFVATELTEAFGINDAAIVDVDGDGSLDILSIGSGFLMVLRGADGFTTPVFHTIGPGSIEGFAVADLDGNDAPDVVVTRGTTADIFVVLNDGFGGFLPEMSAGVGTGWTAVTVADFNADGNVDFAATNEDDSTWTAFLGIGDGSFAAGAPLPAANRPNFGEYSIDAADFNGDEREDVVVVSTSIGDAAIYLGNGDGTFDLSGFVTVGSDPRRVEAVDITGDGNVDVVVGVAESSAGAVGDEDDVAVMIGNGDGTFFSKTNLSLDSTPPTNISINSAFSVSLSDVDNDGFADIVTANASLIGQVGVFYGDSAGAFTAPPVKILIEGQGPMRTLVSDLNGDGTLDVVTANGASGDVSVLLGAGGRNFGPEIRTPAGAGSGALAAGDLDGDGRLDVVTANETSNDLTVLLGNGDGSFTAGQRPTVGVNPTAIALADFDQDGQLDVAVTNSFGDQGISIRLGNGDGTFGSETRLPVIGNAAGITVADFNGDGVPDVATTSDVVFGGEHDAASVHINNGGGSFSAEQRFPVSNTPRDIVTADVDADGVVDLVVLQFTDVSVLGGNGDGTFSEERQFAVVRNHSVQAGDVNADGATDVIVTHDDLNLPEFEGDVSILFNQINLQDSFGVAPSVAITSPNAGATAVEGTRVTVSADATDDIAVVRVEFLLDASLVFVDTVAPYSFSLFVPGGTPTLTLTARAVDLAGAVGTSAPVALTVLDDQPPVVSITSPQNGDTLVEGSATSVSVAAADDVGVASADLFVDGLLAGTDIEAPFTFDLMVPTGVASLTIGAQAKDTAAQVGVAANVVVNVQPDPGTTVVGFVVDSGGAGFEGASVIASGESSTTLADGSFTIPGVPTAPGDIVVSASFTSGTQFLSGASAPTAPVAGGVTDVGTITLGADVFFTTDFQSQGAPGSAVNGAGGTGLRPSNLYSSAQDGTNVLDTSGTDSGIEAFTDSNINGVHLQADGSVLFSVDFNAQGAVGSAVDVAAGTGLLEANLYRSTGDGTNELFLSGDALGIESGTGTNVDGFAVLQDGSILFTVAAGAVGVSGSALESAAGSGLVESNLYRSVGDGTNVLFLSGSDLGIVAFTNSNVDGIAALEDGSLLFSTGPSATGVTGSAVESELFGGLAEAHIYRSTGNGTNELFIMGTDLGMDPDFEASFGAIDGFSLP